MPDFILLLILVVLGVIQIALWLYRSRAMEARLERLEATLRSELAQSRQEAGATFAENRQSLAASGALMLETLRTVADGQQERLGTFSQRLEQVGSTTARQLDQIRASVEERLEAMRQTVDEKLHGTLEKRLGESFRHVSERLEQVHRGLGEMQTLAAGVGDLKRVLANVKTRGNWGEVQLGMLLESMLAPEQFARNVRPHPQRSEVVEYAIRLPGQGEEVWLPVDAKFPMEDYQRLLEAQERCDPATLEGASRALMQRLEASAREIATKYLHPPLTTDFAILFVPTEGLFAEVCRQPGMLERLQQRHRIVVAGPTTFAALLNSLQIGFRTLAIEKQTSRVWRILGEVKTEFGKFGDALDHVKKKLHEATNKMDDVGRRSRAVERQLRQVEAEPEAFTLKE